MASDMEITKDFYFKIGFEVVHAIPEEGNLQWMMLKSGNVTLMFQSRESFTESLPFAKNLDTISTSILYIDVSDALTLYASVLQLGISIVHSPSKTFYNTVEFTISDPNGYMLTFAQDL